MEREDGLGVCVPEEEPVTQNFSAAEEFVEPVARGISKGKRWLLVTSLAAGFLLLVGILIGFFLLRSQGGSKKESFLFLQHGRVYVCLEGMENMPVSLPLNTEYPEIGAFRNEAGTILITVDEKDRLFFLSLTEEGIKKGAKQISSDIEDTYLWRDTVLYQKDSCLFQYDPSTKESKELLSDVSRFLIYNQADTGFLVSRTDKSTWCYDGDSGSFTKIADAPAVVKGYNSDKDSAYVLREGNLYIWRNGKEELLIRDCDGIEQIAEDGSFYFYREEPVSIPLKACLKDDLLEEDGGSWEPTRDGAYYRKQLESFRSAIWVDEKTAAEPFQRDWEGLWLSSLCEEPDQLLFTPIHHSRMEEDTQEYLTLEGNTASLELGLGKSGKYRVTFTFENLEPGAGRPQCKVDIETLREPDPGMEHPAELPVEGVYYNTSGRSETDAEKRNWFRQELQNSTASYTYQQKVLYYYDGSQSVKVTDSFGDSTFGLQPESGLLFYMKEGAPYTLLSELRPEEYSVEAFLKGLQVGKGSRRESKGFGIAAKGKESDTFTAAALGWESGNSFEAMKVNHAGNTLYCQLDTDLYAFTIEGDSLGKPEILEEGIVSFFLDADDALYTVKSEEEGRRFCRGEETIAENVNGYSVSPVDEGEAFVFMDMEGGLYIYDGRSNRKISSNAVSWLALDPNYIVYLERESEAQTGELYVYTGAGSVQIETGVNEILVPYV